MELPAKSVRKPDTGPVLHYSQLEQGVACHLSADHYRQLERLEGQRLDRAFRRRCWKSEKTWESARQLESGILRRRGASTRRFALEHAADSGSPVPQVLKEIEESDDAASGAGEVRVGYLLR